MPREPDPPTFRGEIDGRTVHIEPDPVQLVELLDVLERLHTINRMIWDLRRDLHDAPLPAAVVGRLSQSLKTARMGVFQAEAHANVAARPYRAAALPRSPQEETP